MPLSLPTNLAFIWHQKLGEQVAVRNLTHLHRHIATRLVALLDAGETPTHGELARFAGCGVIANQGALPAEPARHDVG
jgi:hypothetical protein